MLIQNIDTRGLHPRTFALDADGWMVVVGNQMSLLAREGSRVTRIPANLAVYRVGGDGTSISYGSTTPNPAAARP